MTGGVIISRVAVRAIIASAIAITISRDIIGGSLRLPLLLLLLPVGYYYYLGYY